MAPHWFNSPRAATARVFTVVRRAWQWLGTFATPERRRARPRPGARSLIRTRFAIFSGIFFAIQSCLLLFAWLALEKFDHARSLAALDRIYLRVEQAALPHLLRYAQTGDQRHYAAFRGEFAPLAEFRTARLEFEASRDAAKSIERALQRAGHATHELPGLERLFSWFGRWGGVRQVLDRWRGIDAELAGLEAHAERLARAQTGTQRAAAAAAIDESRKRLQAEHAGFAAGIAALSRGERRIAILIFALATLVLWCLGLRFGWRAVRRGAIAERKLIESERCLGDFAEVSSDWFWQSDDGHRITHLSDRFADATGVPARSVLGRSRLADADMDNVIWKGHEKELAARRTFRDFRHPHFAPGGAVKFWSISGTPVFGSRGEFRGYRGTGRDITADVKAQFALSVARNEADKANRAKSHFLAGMSHELRTPLNAILGFSEAMDRKLFGTIENRRYVEYIRDIHGSALHLLALINDILDLAKVEAGRLELVDDTLDVAAVVDEAVGLLGERATAKRVVLEMRVAAGLPKLRADERRLKQIIMNLVSNALKFTPAGGRVVVTVERHRAGSLVLEVADTGIGIAESDFAKVLEPFGQIDSQLARKHQGTGLGLPLTKDLIEAHGGRMELHSTVGVGTRVRAVFPSQRLVSADDSAPSRAMVVTAA